MPNEAIETLTPVATLAGDDRLEVYPAGLWGRKRRATAGQIAGLAIAPLGQPFVAVATVDSVDTTATNRDITGLAVPVEAGKLYRFFFRLAWRSTDTTCGLALGLTWPAATLFAGQVRIGGTSGGGAANEFQGHLNTSGGMITATTAQLANTTLYAEIVGMIRPSANGVVQGRMRAEVSGPTVTVLADSHVEAWTMG